VILDLNMPQMGGHRFLEELLKIDPRQKVLVATGYSTAGQAKTAIEAGARGFVAKPYGMKQMLPTIRKVLDEG
jgi:DNA-binding NarL/FixJ family response regulator